MRRAIAAALLSLLAGVGEAAAQTPAASTGTPVVPEPSRFRASAEALVWWFKNSAAPVPLVSDGLLDDTGTHVLLGGHNLDTNPDPGLRLTLGYAFSDEWGIEGSAFYVPTRSVNRTASSSGLPGSQNLLIPYFTVPGPGESVTNLSAAGRFAGNAREELSTSLLGAELDWTLRLVDDRPWQVELLGGLRYLRLRETYAFKTSSPNVAPQPPDVFQTKDEFDTTNSFYGAQLGLRGRFDWGRLFVSGTAKLAIGAVLQSVDISGSLVTNNFNNLGTPQAFAGGYFAQPSNSGSRSRGVLGLVPELGVTLGCQLTKWAAVTVGYTFLYVNDVARPGQQVDRNINPTQSLSFGGTPPATLVGPARPSFKFTGTDFWAQGVSAGLEIRF